MASSFGGRWRIQPKVTAVYMLAINTICTWLLQCAPNHKLPVCSQLVTYHHVQLPEHLDGFVEPSRNSMARYCLNSVSEIRSSARMLLHGIVQRMTDPMRLSLISKWKKRFCRNGGTASNSMGSGRTADDGTTGGNDGDGDRSGLGSQNPLGAAAMSITGRRGRVPLSVLLGGIVLCIIHSLRRSMIDDAVAESVVNTLIAVLIERVNSNR